MSEEEKLIQDIRNLFRLKKKLKQLKIECSEVLKFLLSMKKENIINH